MGRQKEVSEEWSLSICYVHRALTLDHLDTSVRKNHVAAIPPYPSQLLYQEVTSIQLIPLQVESGRIVVQGQPRQKFSENAAQFLNPVW
jgi:hypothetical protein